MIDEGRDTLESHAKTVDTQIAMAAIAGKIQAYRDILEMEVE